MTDSTAWLNGSTLPFRQLQIPVWDLGVVAGASISEMARTYLHKPFRMAEHVERLVQSCNELGFDLPYDSEQLITAAEDLVVCNSADIGSDEDLGIVWFVTAGANATYLGAETLPGPSVGIHTFRLPFELWAKAADQGVALRVPAIRQMSASTLPIHRKLRNRLHWWLADRQANEIEAGARAILVDEDGHLTETSTSAFYAVIDGGIVTPKNNVLNSMSRRMVEAAANDLQIPFEAANLSLDDVNSFDHAFLSSTPSGLMPVRTLGEHVFPTCDLIDRLLVWWKKETGINPRDQIRAGAGRSS